MEAKIEMTKALEKPTLKIVGEKPLFDEELRLWLENYIATHKNVDTNVLSRSTHIGKSRSALDAYLKGTYFLPKSDGGVYEVPPKSSTSELEPAIRKFRDQMEGTVRHGYANTFVETRAWHQFLHACHTAISENAIIVVYAEPGFGKTRCLQQFTVEKMSTMPISILCSANITTRYFNQKIARELGLDDRVPTARLEDMIAEKLKKNPRPLFVDQANYLNEKALGSICYIWEKAKIPIVLIGTKDLYELFTTTRLTQDVRTQLSSRVAMHYPLRSLSQGEVKAIVQRALKNKATDAVIAKIYNITQGNHRHVDMVIPRIAELEERNAERLRLGEVDYEDIVETAATRLMVA
jgi:DNA transposition AAA+ family ATPase